MKINGFIILLTACHEVMATTNVEQVIVKSNSQSLMNGAKHVIFRPPSTLAAKEEAEIIPQNSTSEEDVEGENEDLIGIADGNLIELNSLFIPYDENEKARYHRLCNPIQNFEVSGIRVLPQFGDGSQEELATFITKNSPVRGDDVSRQSTFRRILSDRRSVKRFGIEGNGARHSKVNRQRIKRHSINGSKYIKNQFNQHHPTMRETNTKNSDNWNFTQSFYSNKVPKDVSWTFPRPSITNHQNKQNPKIISHSIGDRESYQRRGYDVNPSIQSNFDTSTSNVDVGNPEIDINNTPPPATFQRSYGSRCKVAIQNFDSVERFTGVCVPLESCPALTAFSKQKQYTQMSCVLARSLCGFSEGVSLFCCPFYSFSNKLPDNLPRITNPSKKSPISAPIPTPDECGRMKITSDDKKDAKSSEQFERIIGGNFLKLGEFPWLATLGSPLNSRSFDNGCTGSLITRRHVITAAHCLSLPVDSDFTHVRLSEVSLLSNEKPKHQEFLIIAKNYALFHEFIFMNDAAILTLDRDVKFNDYIQPICLPFGFLNSPGVGEDVIVAGFGKQDNLPPIFTRPVNRPKFVSQEVMELSFCQQASYDSSRFFGVIDHRVFCLGGDTRESACFGDSGGPLMQIDPVTKRYILVGLVSAGTAARVCGVRDRPSYHTRVGAFLPWIMSVIQ